MSDSVNDSLNDPKEIHHYTSKQERFCIAFVGKAKGNATRAAILAGYSTKTAYKTAHENLKKGKILKLIDYLNSGWIKGMKSDDIRAMWYHMCNDEKVNISVKARILSDNARANGMYINRQEINIDAELEQAAKTIALLNDSLAYALTFLPSKDKNDVITFMENHLEKENSNSENVTIENNIH